MKVNISCFFIKYFDKYVALKNTKNNLYEFIYEDILFEDRVDIKKYFEDNFDYRGELSVSMSILNTVQRVHCYDFNYQLYLIELKSEFENWNKLENSDIKVCYLDDVNSKLDEFNDIEQEFIKRIYEDKLNFLKVDDSSSSEETTETENVVPKVEGDSKKKNNIEVVVNIVDGKSKKVDGNEPQSVDISPSKVFSDTIVRLVNEVDIVEEPPIPFPQANDFEKVIELSTFIGKNKVKKDDITSYFGFTERQTDYYVNAGVYLGVLRSSALFVELTDGGLDIYKLHDLNKKIEFAKLILSHEIFNVIVKIIIDINKMLPNSVIAELMKEYHLYHINSDDTYLRRASTVAKWIDWMTEINDLCDDKNDEEEFENFVLYSRFNYSFKLVFMYSLLNNIDECGNAHMDDIYVDYMGFYWNRAKRGWKVDKKDCIYTKPFLLDRQKLTSHIAANPLDVYVRQGYLTYDKNNKIINLPKKYIGEYNGEQIERLKQKILQRIDEYYSKL